MKEPFWISLEAAIAFHERQLAEHGGGTGVRDRGLLESALAKPQNLFSYSEGQVDVAAMAASYAYGIATNHPFIDGNKRTALAVSFVFVELNGYAVISTEPDAYVTFLALAAGDLSEDELAAWFRKNIKENK
jgi:death-on-curing protein